MCTVSWCSRKDGYTLFFNRDESRERKPAIPPLVEEIQQTRCIFPKDTEAGGTWLLANEFGLTLGLLNFYEAQVSYSPENRQSRGMLPLKMGKYANLNRVNTAFDDEDLTPFPPFHFLAVDANADALLITWDGNQKNTTSPRWEDLPITTSSFETARVVAARKALFEKEVQTASNKVKAMENYHCRKRPEPPTYGVLMTRKAAKTVSVSQVRVTDSQVSMSYRARPGDDAELDATETASIGRV